MWLWRDIMLCSVNLFYSAAKLEKSYCQSLKKVLSILASIRNYFRPCVMSKQMMLFDAESKLDDGYALTSEYVTSRWSLALSSSGSSSSSSSSGSSDKGTVKNNSVSYSIALFNTHRTSSYQRTLRLRDDQNVEQIVRCLRFISVQSCAGALRIYHHFRAQLFRHFTQYAGFWSHFNTCIINV